MLLESQDDIPALSTYIQWKAVHASSSDEPQELAD
jgi:hypothetical protein